MSSLRKESLLYDGNTYAIDYEDNLHKLENYRPQKEFNIWVKCGLGATIVLILSAIANFTQKHNTSALAGAGLLVVSIIIGVITFRYYTGLKTSNTENANKQFYYPVFRYEERADEIQRVAADNLNAKIVYAKIAINVKGKEFSVDINQRMKILLNSGVSANNEIILECQNILREINT
jgi:flagellar basal body-associated protein FliL